MTDYLAAMNDRSSVWARNPIIAGFRGSHAHGTYIPPEDPKGTDDVDVFGVVVRDADYYFGLDGYRPDRKGTFCCAGETLDIETHEVRKFVYLLMKGNPNVHQHLWLKPEHYFTITRPGRIILERREAFLSRHMFHSLAGYAYEQAKRMVKFEKRGYMGQKREAIMREHGYDVKNAAHLIRLLYMAIHLAQHDNLMVWLDEKSRCMVMSVKRGEWGLQAVQDHAERLFNTFDTVKRSSSLREAPDRDMVNATLREVIDAHWEDLHQ